MAYLREDTQDESELAFVIGKSRIAPMRQLSIPRLELQAAMYATRLRDSIIAEHDLVFSKICDWSDSMTVLHWLHSSHKKQTVFVANRIAEILENSTIDEWNFVNGLKNPADIGTRGMTISELNDSDWIKRPQ